MSRLGKRNASKRAGIAGVSNPVTIEFVAEQCHEANRELCRRIGDDSQPEWKDAPEWQQKSAINGVQFHLDTPDAKPSDSHDSWLAEKEADGWKYGEVKDPEAKEHPCFVPYDELPVEQQEKDSKFIEVVDRYRKTLVEGSAE